MLWPKGIMLFGGQHKTVLSLIAHRYEQSVLGKLRDEMKRRETNNQREPIATSDVDSTLTIRMWDL
jgi:hypothetical protein